MVGRVQARDATIRGAPSGRRLRGVSGAALALCLVLAPGSSSAQPTAADPLPSIRRNALTALELTRGPAPRFLTRYERLVASGPFSLAGLGGIGSAGSIRSFGWWTFVIGAEARLWLTGCGLFDAYAARGPVGPFGALRLELDWLRAVDEIEAHVSRPIFHLAASLGVGYRASLFRRMGLTVTFAGVLVHEIGDAEGLEAAGLAPGILVRSSSEGVFAGARLDERTKVGLSMSLGFDILF